MRSAASAARYGVIEQRRPNSAAVTLGASVSFFLRCPVGAQRAARNDQQNLAAFTILASLYARARNKRRAADGLSNNRKQGDCYPIALAEALSLKSPIPKERLRVSNWIVQRLYNYAVNETVEL